MYDYVVDVLRVVAHERRSCHEKRDVVSRWRHRRLVSGLRRASLDLSDLLTDLREEKSAVQDRARLRGGGLDEQVLLVAGEIDPRVSEIWQPGLAGDCSGD